MTSFIIGSIMLPALTALSMSFFMRQRSSSVLHAVSAAVVIISMAFAYAAFAYAAFADMPPPAFCFSWLASAGEMCLSLSKSPLFLIILNALLLLFFLALSYLLRSDLNASSAGLILFSYSSLQVALLSESFLLRYAALEMVGLAMVAAVVVLLPSPALRWKNASLSFLNLKVGDLALLIAIFIMNAATRNFDISLNLLRAESLPPVLRAATALALLLAVWVKMSVWPLGQWDRINLALPSLTRFWLIRASLPLLGAYLLYRSLPLIQSVGFIPVWLPWVCLIAWFTGLRRVRSQEGLVRSQFHYSSVFMILAAPFIAASEFFLLVIFWILARFPLALAELVQDFADRSRSKWFAALTIIAVQFANLCAFYIFWRADLTGTVDQWVQLLFWTIWFGQLFITMNGCLAYWREAAPLRAGHTGTSMAFIIGLSVIGSSFLIWMVDGLLKFVAQLVKGPSFSLLPGPAGMVGLPFRSSTFWLACLTVVLLRLGWSILNNFQPRLERTWTLIRDRARTFSSSERSSVNDPLDVSGAFTKFFINGARAVYRFVEQGGAASLFVSLGRTLRLLFRKTENFNSTVIWSQLLEFFRKRTLDLQQMHAGFLRTNLMLLLAFIVLVMLIVWLNLEGVWL